jgi:hypothetical protein
MALRIFHPTQTDPETLGKCGSSFAMGFLWTPLYIAYSFVVGTFLLVLPWMTIWDDNYIVYNYPHIRSIVSNSFLKGAVLGLGIINILIGLQEIAILWKRAKARIPN